MGAWANIVGFLRGDRTLPPAQNLRSRLLISSGWTVFVIFLAGILYLRQTSIGGSPQAYLYLEIGGTLLSFCYAANALVRFRATHDRTALILASIALIFFLGLFVKRLWLG